MSLRTILAAGLLIVAAAAPSPAMAEGRSVRLSFEVFSGGIRVLSLDSTSTFRGDSYAIEARLKTEGIAHTLVKFDSIHRVTGLLAEMGAKPARFESRSTSRFGQREVMMAFGPDGSIEAEVQPPPDEDGRAPVPPQYRRGALDPLSALLVQVTSMDPADPCVETTSVFDGRRLYNLHFHYLGREELAPSRFAAYAGAVVKCRVDFERLKGFEDGGELRRKTRDPIYVWLAWLDGHNMTVPVRLETDTDWGSVIAHLTDYRIRQQSAAAYGG